MYVCNLGVLLNMVCSWSHNPHIHWRIRCKWSVCSVHIQTEADVPLTHVCCRANEEIAQVRGRSNAECVALNASLRKEQMKVESLERALEQKVNISLNLHGSWINSGIFCSATLSITGSLTHCDTQSTYVTKLMFFVWWQLYTVVRFNLVKSLLLNKENCSLQ